MPEETKAGNKQPLPIPEDKKEEFLEVKQRIENLQKTRENIFGVNLDSLWADADKDYVPHRLKTKGTKVIATDEEKGWRGNMVTLGTSDWQADFSTSNVFVKIQVALSTLIDQNPSGIFTATMQRFQAATALIEQLYKRSWSKSKSIYQLKLFVYNLAKYGWAVGRTYPLRIEREVKILTEYNPEDPSKSKYEKKKVVEYNDIFRENLDPRNVWIDDMAKPNNEKSIRDWTWRKVYTYQDAKAEFGKYPLFQNVPEKGGGITSDTIDKKGKDGKNYESENLVEVVFYENRVTDRYHVHIAGVPVIMEPMPISDRSGAKRLSLWQTYWMLRHAETPYGIGMYESIRYNQSLLDRLRNMSLDQLTLSIYKMFFYQGTQNLQETGEIKVQPGVGKQVIDPKNITWLETPGPGQEAWQGQDRVQAEIDNESAVTDPLMGVVTGKTAFELAQAKESALNRLKVPFDNILEALENEAYITLALVQLLYSIPETYEISDPRLIEDYLKEIKSDSDLYEREDTVDEYGVPKSKFTAKVYPEFPLNLDQDERGNLIETQDTQFFRIKPKMLDWEGIINIKAQSVLTPSKQIDKALDMEFYNMFIPLLTTLDQERQMASQMGGGGAPQLDELPHGKTAKELAKLYDKDPRDVFPESWFEEPQAEEEQVPAEAAPQAPAEQPLILQPGEVPPEQQAVPVEAPPMAGEAPAVPQEGQTSADLFVAQPTAPASPTGFASKVMSRLTQPFRKV